MFDPSLMIAPNVGGMIQQGIEKGQQQRQQNMAKGALAALVRDPTNQRALAALAQVDPERAMEFRKQQIEYTKAQLGQHQDSILKAAELFRAAKAANPNAPDEQVYAVAFQAAQQAGLPIADVPPPGDPRVPGYIKGLMTIAEGLKPQTDVQDPGIIREFDIATQRGLVPPGTTYQQYVTMRNPGMSAPVTIPYGAQVQGVGASAPAVTATGPNGQKIQLNPQMGQWEPVGGAGGNASGGFPQ